MTKEELAEKINKVHYGDFIGYVGKDIIQQAKDSSLLIVRGFSDDIISFDGGITDETYEGKRYFDKKGFLPDLDTVKEDWENEEDAQRWFNRKKNSRWIIGKYGDDGMWRFDVDEVAKKHSVEFNILDDGELYYCIGLVVDLKEIF